MSNNKVDLSDNFENVTILISNIVGFSNYTSSVKAEQVLQVLRRLVIEFDKQVLNHKIYKVYTIGDRYLAIGLLNSEERDPLNEAKKIISFGFSLISILRSLKGEKDFKEIDMRIGVHTGKIMGGIVGTGLVRYDIYGPDVLIANKIESNGIIGNIMISSETKNLLQKERNDCPYRFHFKKEIEIESLEKNVACYLIEQNDNL